MFQTTEYCTCRGRVEIGGVYLPSQMERTPQLCLWWQTERKGKGVHPPPSPWFYHHDGMYQQWPTIATLCVQYSVFQTKNWRYGTVSIHNTNQVRYRTETGCGLLMRHREHDLFLYLTHTYLGMRHVRLKQVRIILRACARTRWIHCKNIKKTLV
jgi:hypothetical protein